MILLKTLFYILYSFSYRTNKGIPEWSTIIAISILLTFNTISFLVLFNIPIERIGESGFKFMPLVFTALNWFYFLNKKRYLKILKNPPLNKNLLLLNIVVIIYVVLTIVFFFTMLKISNDYILATIIFLSFVMIIAYFSGSDKKE